MTVTQHTDPAAAVARGVHPGLLMAAFFLILIGFNVAFFTIAASTPVEIVERDDPRVLVVEQRAAPAAAPTIPVEGRR